MKRLHLHIRVADIERSAKFYAALFGREPDKREADYAKWMLDDPRANIAISTRSWGSGFDHAGLQVDSEAELEELAARLKDAGLEAAPEKDTTCCYARSDKYWAKGPEGAVWELFRSFGDSETYSGAPAEENRESAGACC